MRRITVGAEKIMQGDFSARIEPFGGASEAGFNTVIDYFNRMAEELSSVETLRTDFIANVSQELKIPLAVIQNYATMLQSPGLSDERRVEYAKAIAESSRRRCLQLWQLFWDMRLSLPLQYSVLRIPLCSMCPIQHRRMPSLSQSQVCPM